MIFLKKRIFFLFLFFFLFLPTPISARDLKLEDLTIKNGKLSIPFEPLNNEYTVILESDVDLLELEYKVDENINVSVTDNENLVNNSVVTINLTEEKNTVEYHLHILKEEEEKTENVFLEQNALPMETNIMYEYKNYIIPSVCFLLIFIVFKILFHKKRKHKKTII